MGEPANTQQPSPDEGNYRTLDPAKIVDTVVRLHRRITDRFPDSGLSRVCEQLLAIARRTKQRTEWIGRPILALRLATAVLVVLVIAASVSVLVLTKLPNDAVDVLEFVQLFEAGINDVVLIGIAIFFLVSLERRVKRRRALSACHELRIVAHLIDIHQLTKDPERLLARGTSTESSPKLKMTPFELSRYLDYCSEMLSLVGKIAALYVQNFDDEVSLNSANEIETLTTGLSRKIWQKLVILNSLRHDAEKGTLA